MSSEADMLMIPFSKIDAAWKDLHKDIAWGKSERELHEQYRDVVLAYLAVLNIVACEECGGSGQGGGDPKALTESCWPCEPCHGHGWIITSQLVDKCGRIGTGRR